MNVTHRNHLLVIQRELRRLYATSKILSESIKELEIRVQSMVDDRPKEFNLCGLRITRQRKSKRTPESYCESFTTDLVSIPIEHTNLTENHYAEACI